MKKIISTAVGIFALAGALNAATMTITTRYGESLMSYVKTDNNDDDDDGFYFFDHYMANGSEGQASNMMSFNNVSFDATNNVGGVEMRVGVPAKNFSTLLLNGWINFGRNFTVKVGRFNAYPLVDMIGDATQGYHYNSYAAQYNAGFDPQVMSLFVREQNFSHETNSRISSSLASTDTLSATSATLEAYNWYFYDPNNAGGRIDYDTTYYGIKGGLMAEYRALDDNLTLRLVAVPGSAADNGNSFSTGYGSPQYYGEKTLTNLNFQASYNVPDVVKIGATVKMSDMFSGVYNSGSGIYKSAGTDLSASLAVSSDYFYNTKLFASYMFGDVFMGRESTDGKNESYMLHAADVRAIYEIADNFRVGFNGNLSMIQQSEYAKEIAKASDTELDDYMGFSVGLSGSYDLSDSIAFDLTTGFRCVNVNNRNTKGDKDMMAVSCFGIEPGAVFKLSKQASVNLGVNVLLQNLSSNGDDAAETIWLNNNKNSAKTNVVFPHTLAVTLPFYMKVTL